MTFGPPLNENSQAVLKAIKAAKAEGIGTQAIVKASGLTLAQTRVCIKNLASSGKIARKFEHTNSGQLYLADEYAPKKPNLPPRSDSVTAITKAQPRNYNISPERVAVEAVLAKSTEALRPDVIATRTKVDISRVRKLLQTLRYEGIVSNTGTTLDPRWKACARIKLDNAASRERSGVRVANGNQPAAPAYYLPSMACVRPGADDHRMIPSREGDRLKSYRAPASMVSA